MCASFTRARVCWVVHAPGFEAPADGAPVDLLQLPCMRESVAAGAVTPSGKPPLPRKYSSLSPPKKLLAPIGSILAIAMSAHCVGLDVRSPVVDASQDCRTDRRFQTAQAPSSPICVPRTRDLSMPRRLKASRARESGEMADGWPAARSSPRLCSSPLALSSFLALPPARTQHTGRNHT